MARVTADSQLVFRAESPMKVELEAIAKALDKSSSKILRDVLEEVLPALRAKADEEIKRREKLPHGITPDALEKALASLLRKISLDEPIHIELHDLLSPESKAVWTLLGYLWGDHASEADHKAATATVTSFANEKKRPSRR